MTGLVEWQYFYPPTGISADFKLVDEDFIVEEQLGFEPEGEGEHVFLYVEKAGLTTDRLVSELAKKLNLAKKQIAYSGLKDKQALTRQWLSMPWPIKQELPELDDLTGDQWRVLTLKRHLRKLKRGVHQANQFTITLKNIVGDKSLIEQRLELIKAQGVPNYFGPQRFGFAGSNIEKARELLQGKLKMKPAQRSIYYSAARSFLFNQYLSKRIAVDFFNKPMLGDVFMLEGSHSIFSESVLSDDILARFNQQDIHSTGLLHGDGKAFDEDAQSLWQQVLDEEQLLAEGLIKAGLKSHYRALRLPVKSLNWQWQNNNQCVLAFSLPAGCFATAVLRELVILNEAVW